MKTLVCIIAALALICLVLSASSSRSGRSQDEKLDSLIFLLPGILFTLIDIVLIVAWGLYRLFTT